MPERQAPIPDNVRADAALEKVSTQCLTDGDRAHCFRTLLEALATVVRNTCRIPGDTAATFDITTTPNDFQRRAAQLIDAIVP